MGGKRSAAAATGLVALMVALGGCGSSAPLDEPFTVSGDSERSVDGTGIVVTDCWFGEDQTEDGPETWVALSGSLDGEPFSYELYGVSTEVGDYEIRILGADRDGGCELEVTRPGS